VVIFDNSYNTGTKSVAADIRCFNHCESSLFSIIIINANNYSPIFEYKLLTIDRGTIENTISCILRIPRDSFIIEHSLF